MLLSNFAFRKRSSQQGVSLIESLVALLILALGVLGLLGFQLRTMVDNQSANQIAHAARLAEELFERVKTNPDNDPAFNANFNIATPLAAAQWNWLGNYVLNWGTAVTANTNCSTTLCTSVPKATWDLARWKESVEATLPDGRVRVLRSPDSVRQLIVIIGWRAKEGSNIASPIAVSIPNVTAPTDCSTTHNCYFAYGQP